MILRVSMGYSLYRHLEVLMIKIQPNIFVLVSKFLAIIFMGSADIHLIMSNHNPAELQ